MNVWALCPPHLPSLAPPAPAQESKDPEAIVLQCCPTKPARRGGWRRVGAFPPCRSHQRPFSTCLECESHSGDTNRTT